MELNTCRLILLYLALFILFIVSVDNPVFLALLFATLFFVAMSIGYASRTPKVLLLLVPTALAISIALSMVVSTVFYIIIIENLRFVRDR